MTQLVLKRGKFSRPSGQWKDEDYDVLADGKVVGRILEEGSRFGPSQLRWGWSITAIVPANAGRDERHRRDARKGHGQVSRRMDEGSSGRLIGALGGDARGRDGRVREELAEGSKRQIGGPTLMSASLRLCSTCVRRRKRRLVPTAVILTKTNTTMPARRWVGGHDCPATFAGTRFEGARSVTSHLFRGYSLGCLFAA
jgi:hypothetical protein